MSRTTLTVLTLMLLSAVAVAAISASSGVSVVVQNKGPGTISNVAVHVTGNSYDIGALKPGQTQTIRVTAKGESHLEITFTDSSRNQNRVVADCYFEDRHYKGSITVDIAGNKISRVDERIELSLF